jgi:hypothetical protein
MELREKLIDDLESYAREIFAAESPFYTELLARMAADVASSGPVWELLEPFAGEPATEYYPLRALAGVHKMVLDGSARGLERHYPSVGGDGDAAAAWPEVLAALESHSPEVVDDLRHPLQTNETSRCGPLASGLHLIAARHPGRPVRALELGSSAGLNLNLDRYRYEAGGLASGPADSPVRFADYWRRGVPPLDSALVITERRGCDIDPIDTSTEEGRLDLLAYVMPDEPGRVQMMRGALEVAAAHPVVVDRASADEWIAGQLAAGGGAAATIVFHSVFWIYPPAEVTDRIEATIRGAGEAAGETHPFFWLRYEESVEHQGLMELRLTSWPGGEEELLATGRHHYAPIRWLGPAAGY